jgi:cation transport ATPase
LGTPEELFKRQFGSDLLAGISTLTAIALREYLVATIVVLMLSGGEALEEYATALDALARRMRNVAHRKEANGLARRAASRHAHRRRVSRFAAGDLPGGRRGSRRPRHHE